MSNNMTLSKFIIHSPILAENEWKTAGKPKKPKTGGQKTSFNKGPGNRKNSNRNNSSRKGRSRTSGIDKNKTHRGNTSTDDISKHGDTTISSETHEEITGPAPIQNKKPIRDPNTPSYADIAKPDTPPASSSKKPKSSNSVTGGKNKSQNSKDVIVNSESSSNPSDSASSGNQVDRKDLADQNKSQNSNTNQRRSNNKSSGRIHRGRRGNDRNVSKNPKRNESSSPASAHPKLTNKTNVSSETVSGNDSTPISDPKPETNVHPEHNTGSSPNGSVETSKKQDQGDSVSNSNKSTAKPTPAPITSSKSTATSDDSSSGTSTTNPDSLIRTPTTVNALFGSPSSNHINGSNGAVEFSIPDLFFEESCEPFSTLEDFQFGPSYVMNPPASQPAQPLVPLIVDVLPTQPHQFSNFVPPIDSIPSHMQHMGMPPPGTQPPSQLDKHLAPEGFVGQQSQNPMAFNRNPNNTASYPPMLLHYPQPGHNVGPIGEDDHRNSTMNPGTYIHPGFIPNFYPQGSNMPVKNNNPQSGMPINQQMSNQGNQPSWNVGGSGTLSPSEDTNDQNIQGRGPHPQAQLMGGYPVSYSQYPYYAPNFMPRAPQGFQPNPGFYPPVPHS